MNTPSKLDILHGFYGKAKFAFLIVFSFSIVFLSLISHSAYGESVVGTVQTRLAVKIDGKTQNITTTQNNIDAALKQNNIDLAQNDITEPPLNTYLGGKTINVNVIRAIPVLITDGNQSWAGKSAYTQPFDILKQLDVTIYPEDKVSAELILDPAAVGLVGQDIIINRAPVYTIYVDGETKVVRSWANTIGDVLNGNVTLGQRDIVVPSVDQKAISGEITITRINVFDTDEVNPIQYQTVYDDNYYLAQGKTNTVTAGVNGSKSQTFRVTMKDGIMVDKTLLTESILQGPVTAVIERGKMPSNSPFFRSDYWDWMVQAGSQYGVSALDLFNVASCESHVNANSAGSYYGMFQYGLDFWASASADAGFAGVSWNNAKAQIFTTAKYTAAHGWGRWGCKP